MSFDYPKDRRTAFASKWQNMESFSGVSPDDGIAMWVADMDFDAPACVRDRLRADIEAGFLGYVGDIAPARQAVCDWMRNQHGWDVHPDWVSFSHGVIAGFGMALEAFSEPGDGVILFSPVYHAFYTRTRAKGRDVVESQLALRDGRYEMDLDALAAQLKGHEKIAVLCSPHNPGGRLWSKAEIAELADFCEAHDLLLLSDEIHMDLCFPGARHIPTAIAAPQATARLVTISAASKGFNIAGGETGFIIVEDPSLRARIDAVQKALGGTPNRFGIQMTHAAFAEGGGWSADLRAYLAENFALWRDRIGALPGVSVMDMSSTYLAWVDFSGTGMDAAEIQRRIAQGARIATSPGASFGTGGETFYRFNLAMPRARVIEAIERMEKAFGDLQ